MHNYKERICNYCGKPYKPTSSTQGACPECMPLAKKDQRTAYNLKRNRAKPKVEPKRESRLEEIETKARAKGMSYGQYQAIKLLEYARVEI